MNEECRLSRNEGYDKNVTANNASISKIHRLILSYKSEQGKKIINLVNNTANDYYQKIMQHNTYTKVEKLALHLI